MSLLINGMTAEQLLDVFKWARIGANNCMIGYGVVATELPDHGDLIDRDKLPKYTGDALSAVYVAKAVDNAPVVIPTE